MKKLTVLFLCLATIIAMAETRHIKSHPSALRSTSN